MEMNKEEQDIIILSNIQSLRRIPSLEVEYGARTKRENRRP